MASFARLSHRALILVEGAHARAFLNRLLTQEVETLEPGGLRHAALLTPQGRVLHDLFLFGEEGAVVLDVDAGSRDAIMLRLNAYRLRAAITLAAPPGGICALWNADAAPAGWRRDPRAPAAGLRLAAAAAPPSPPGAVDAGADAYRRHRFALALTDAAQDGLGDKAYATEANLDLAHGVDFSKGCFVGQETTSRMKRRGGVRSRVLPLEACDGTLDAALDAAPGDAVLAGERRAGEVCGVAGGLALAMLRLDRALSFDGPPLTLNGRRVRLAIPADWRAAVSAPISDPNPSPTPVEETAS